MNTLNYYDSNAKEYYDKTVGVDFAKNRGIFLAYLQEGASLLDFGCGSGRDAKAFIDAGYKVEAIDGSAELCKLASEYTGIEVKNMLFSDFNEMGKYDGIWACASILHLPYEELKAVMTALHKALKLGGVFYTTFKYGKFEGIRDERYYIDFDEEKISQLLDDIQVFQLEKNWITQDVIPGRETQKWLNIILKK